MAERADHLQWCLKQLTTLPDDVCVPGLTKSQSRIIAALWDGEWRSSDYILAAIYWDRHCDEWPTENCISAHLSHARHALKAAGLRIEGRPGGGRGGRRLVRS